VLTCCPMARLLLFAGILTVLGSAIWPGSSSGLSEHGISSHLKTSRLEGPETSEPAGWGSIKGRIIFGGAALPAPPALNVTSDQGHCLTKGPIKDETWVVDPASKGVANVVAFILPGRDETLPIHADYQAPPKDFVLDQPYCVFTPHVFAIRKGQRVIAKNPDPVAHNVVVKGLDNDINVQVPPGTEKSIEIRPEHLNNPVVISCGSHPWMKGHGWCFEHPYFAVSGKDGRFEIKNIPAGNRKLILWHEEKGFLPGFGKRSGDQKILVLQDGASVDLGDIKLMPKQ
jgi:hypothetical protein